MGCVGKKKITNRFTGRAGELIDIEAACAELVAAKYLDIYWDGSVGTFQLPDVGRFQVRHTQHEKGRLPIHRRDKDNEYFILVTGHTPTYCIRGYILAKDGKKQKYWDDPTGNYPAFFVPQNVLKPIEELKKALIAFKSIQPL